MASGSRVRIIAALFGAVLVTSAAVGWVINRTTDDDVSVIAAGPDPGLPNGGMSSEFDGVALPTTAISSISGEQTSLAALGGNGLPMLINLWYTSCKPCREEMPEFEKAFQELDGRMSIIGLNVQDSASQAAEYADEVGVSYPIFVDPSGAILDDLEISAFPATLIVDAEGVIQHTHLGALTADEILSMAPAELGG